MTVKWLMLLLAVGLTPLAAGLSCAPCGDTACPEVICPGGTVVDVCGCCKVCARGEGERCGGYFDTLGRCGEGLLCKTRPQHGQLIGGTIEGTCTRDDEITCEFCQLMLGKCVCVEIPDCDLPDVSNNPTSFTSRSACDKAAHKAGQATIVPTVGVASCPGVVCEHSIPYEIGCPSDSVLKRTPSKRPDCCPDFSECVCDLESCPVVAKCPRGQEVELLSAGQRVPGQCCSQWACRPAEHVLAAQVMADPIIADPILAKPISVNPTLADPTLAADPILAEQVSTASTISTTDVSSPSEHNPENHISTTSSVPLSSSSAPADPAVVSSDNPPMTSSRDPCGDVTCPPAGPCPADSYRLPSQQDPPHCCKGACQCLPDQCRPPTCSDGMRVKVMSAGTGRPGSCCPVYQCDVAPTCTHEGRTYRDGDTWKSNECTTCHCKNALTFCKPVECPPLVGCGHVAHDREHCCPRCVDGCVSPSGVYHNSSEQWLENDCMTCSCEADKLHCHTEMCHTTCQNPRRVPGRCCPACDETECDMVCRHGYRTDAHGVALCECLSADEVAEDPPRCRSMAGCRRRCPHGYKLDDNGCERCKCKRCRKMKNCSLTCPLATNERGCNICRCRVADETELTSVGTPSVGSANSCVSDDGTVHTEKSSWHDGCRECFCHHGVEMCAMISCPVPVCRHPEIAPGHCCPTCPDSSSPLPRYINASVCQSVNGATYLEGQTWQLDSCTRCVCESGRVMCSSPQCPPAACAHPKRPDASCCAICPLDVSPLAPGGGRACRIGDGSVRRHGDTWRSGVCQSCRCEQGEVRCFHEKCPKLDCDHPVLKKGQCCPQCIEPSRNSSCVYEEQTLLPGQRLVVDACTSCTCQSGQVTCARKVCSSACDNPTPVPGECCPICSVTSHPRRNYMFLNGTSKAAHRTRLPMPERPTQTSRPGMEREKGGSQSSLLHYGLYGLLSFFLLVVLIACGCVYWHRRRSGYEPKQEVTDEKKPLNGGPQAFDCSHLNNVAVLQNKRVHGEKNGISIIRDT